MTRAALQYEAKKEAAAQRLASEVVGGGREIGLRKRTSNLFRPVGRKPQNRLDLGRFDRVIGIEKNSLEAEVEGRITYESLVSQTLKHGLLPPVVPQLKSITLGGAIAGGGIESSSFRHGFVHESVKEIDLLLSSGKVVTCHPENEYNDLFYGIPNSYGTLGYVLRARIPLVKAGPFVRLTHHRFESAPECFAAMREFCEEKGKDGAAPTFVDGAVFSGKEHYVTVGHFVSEVPYVSDYRFMRIFYQSIRERTVDYLRTEDYIWRWDTDWFWCSRALGMEIKPIRFLFGSLGLLRSTTYWKIRQMAIKSGVKGLLDRRSPREDVIQDVEIPIGKAAEFLDFFRQEIGILPVWLCPAKAPNPSADFVLYRTDPETLYVNFGFWGSVPSDHPSGFFNRLVERKVMELGGKKSLYSSSYFPEEEFWRIYNREAYRRLKEKYDPEGRLKDLYRKCVG